MRAHIASTSLELSTVFTLVAPFALELFAMDSVAIPVLILGTGALGLGTAAYYGSTLALIKVFPGAGRESTARTALLGKTPGDEEYQADVYSISHAIADGANAFLRQEYQFMSMFVGLFGALLFILLGTLHSWDLGLFTLIAFLAGAMTSLICGFIGMRTAVYTNSRTTLSAQRGIEYAFGTAFRGGCVMGFVSVSLAMLVLYGLIVAFSMYYTDVFVDPDTTKVMFEAIAGYGLGGSTVALFGRVGGGIYTKAADVGADLAGKVEEGLPEDDPRNPATIADNVGDNVGDIAGMGADLFGSFAEASCAAMVIASQSPDLFSHWPALAFPLVLSGAGIIVSLLTALIATHLTAVRSKSEIEPALKRQLLVSTAAMTPVAFVLAWLLFPSEFHIGSEEFHNLKLVKNYYVFFAVIAGLWSGLIIGYTTEYFTSHSYKPVREVANACRTGAATNIIYGLALGWKSAIVPTFLLAATMYISFSLGGMFLIACAALGILSTLATGLAIDSYGPISDNAGGIAEMAGLPPGVRDITDALDSAGNTTAAIGKGFAIASAALVSLALFGAFVTTVNLAVVDMLSPFVYAGLVVGANLPFWFSAMTMKSVGEAALAMVEEVRRQFSTVPVDNSGRKDFTNFRADYATCVAISTKAAISKMMAPGALVMFTPLVAGFLFGVEALAGVLAGALVCGVQNAISMSNTGGAWDNAKKLIESGFYEGQGKGSQLHKAAVVGDTVGDPLKDTSGPSLNILIKLSAIISLVLAPAFPSIESGGLLVQLFGGSA